MTSISANTLKNLRIFGEVRTFLLTFVLLTWFYFGSLNLGTYSPGGIVSIVYGYDYVNLDFVHETFIPFVLGPISLLKRRIVFWWLI